MEKYTIYFLIIVGFVDTTLDRFYWVILHYGFTRNHIHICVDIIKFIIINTHVQ